jgi:hypothetical protein
MDLVSVAEELYGLSPEEFVPTRAARTKEAKAAGDKQLAADIAALAKPTAAAWAVNMLVRHQREEIAQLLQLGAALRQAQDDLDGEQLRQLGKQRRQLTVAMSTQAKALALQLGHKISEAVTTQVQETLHAAMTDAEAAAAVGGGLLVGALSPTGMGQVDLTGAVALGGGAIAGATAGAARSTRGGVARGDSAEAAGSQAEALEASPGRAQLSVVREEERKAEQARRALERAEQAAAEAERESAKAERKAEKKAAKVARLEAHVLRLQSDLDEVRRRAAELEHELDQVDDELSTAEAERDSSRQRAEQAGRRATEAREAVERLRG